MSFLVQVTAAKTITLWHGGDLDVVKDEHNHRGGRWEHGPGLYLTARWDVANKYAKGGRKLYKVEVAEGNEIRDVKIDRAKTDEFINTFAIKSKRKELLERCEAKTKDGKIPAHIFLNIFINEKGIKNTEVDHLRRFLVANGVDYQIESSTFGFPSVMLVLFNMEKIVAKHQIGPKEKIEVYELPNEFQ